MSQRLVFEARAISGHVIRLAPALAGVVAGVLLTGNARGQEEVAPPAHADTVLSIDSGPLSSPRAGQEVVFSRAVSVAGARWLRLTFGDVSLAGDPAANGATLRIMSMEDGAVQYLNAETLRQWRSTSAYFNGDTVVVDLIAAADSGESRVNIEGVTAGAPCNPDATTPGTPPTTPAGGYTSRSLCGPDSRTLTASGGNARLLPAGCTTFMINDANRMFLSAGHCGVADQTVIEFNVPLSRDDGTIVHPAPQDQYVVDVASIQDSDSGLGSDWAYFGVFPNSNTGLTPVQAQNAYYTLAEGAGGNRVRVTGYGMVSAPVTPAWNQVQKSDEGPVVARTDTFMTYRADTTAGNSGSPVIDAVTGQVLAIHGNSGCEDAGGGNAGTAITVPGLVQALANPLGVCGSGATPPGPAQGALFAVGDMQNNFGSISANGGFTSMAQLGPAMQGLAYDANLDRFLIIDTSRGLYAIDGRTGDVSFLGAVTNTTEIINGLGYDPRRRVLWGIAQASGQLYMIDPGTLRATRIGSPRGGTVGGLDFDSNEGILYGMDDAPGGTRLVRISTRDGTQTVVGSLGTGITDCNGLAYDPYTRQLYTINAPTRELLEVEPLTGRATRISGINGVFGSSFGLAARGNPNPNCTADFDRDGDSGTDADIERFFLALGGHPCAACGSVDIDGDGDVGTDRDIEAFFRVLGGGRC